MRERGKVSKVPSPEFGLPGVESERSNENQAVQRSLACGSFRGRKIDERNRINKSGDESSVDEVKEGEGDTISWTGVAGQRLKQVGGVD